MRSPTVRSLESLDAILKPHSTVLCLYSGGLDGTYLLHRLSRLPSLDVIALTVDLGGDFQPDAAQQAASTLCGHSVGGSVFRCVTADRCAEFARDYVLPSIAAQAKYLGGHPICASLSRPLMAAVACEVAARNDCRIIVHTSNRSQNSLRRFNGSLAGLGFEGDFGSPFELSSISRERKIDELRGAGIVVGNNSVYSTDSNLWGREFESGEIDDPERVVVPEHLYRWTKQWWTKNRRTKDRWTEAGAGGGPQSLCVTFAGGVPVSVNGKSDVLSSIEYLNETAGGYGLGRYIGLEEIAGGVKVQEVREMPAACVLLDAYKRLESASVGAEYIREKMSMEQLWVREAVEGRWFGAARAAAQAFIQSVAKGVTGSVCYELSPNLLELRSLQAEKPLYVRNRGFFESQESELFRHERAESLDAER